VPVVTIVCTPIINPPVGIVRTKDHYGVGEVVDLSVDVKPASQAALLGNLTFSANGGRISNALPAAGTARFTAGDQKATVQLKVTDVNRNQLATKTIFVIAPNEIKMTTVTLMPPPLGQPGAGFLATRIRLHPLNICFENIEVREGTCKAVANGYYQGWHNLVHPVGNWADVVDFNDVLLDDDIQSGDPGGQLANGVFEWPIPWEYRVGATGTARQIAIVRHKQEINVLGHVTIWKGGKKAERNPG